MRSVLTAFTFAFLAWSLVFAIATFASACGPHRWASPDLPLPVEAAPNVFDLSEQAIEAINAAAGEQVVVMGARAGETVWIVHVDYKAVGCGEFFYGDREIQVTSCRYEGSEQIVLVHELGHALGLNHVADPASIMAPVFRRMTLEQAAESLVKELRQ